MVKVKVFE